MVQRNLLWIQLKAAAHVAIEDSLVAPGQTLKNKKGVGPSAIPSNARRMKAQLPSLQHW